MGALHVVHVTLPLGVSLQINRWTEADDDRLQIRARIGKTGVDPNALLFGHKTPVAVANRPDVNDCPSDTMKRAEELCKKKESSFFPSQECLIDVCFGGPGFATEA